MARIIHDSMASEKSQYRLIRKRVSDLRREFQNAQYTFGKSPAYFFG
jgi:hypothetical protein